MNLVYYAIVEDIKSSGVNKKINQFVGSINKTTNLIAEKVLIKPGYFSSFRLAFSIASTDQDIIFIRGNSYGLFIAFFGMIIAKIRGKKIILDIATPQSVVVREIPFEKSNNFVKLLKLLGMVLSGPWVFMFADRVIQYGVEGKWFSCLGKEKLLLIGNGCDTGTIREREIYPEWPSNTIKLLIVANVNRSHGIDLLIKAISSFNKTHKNKKIELTVVGEGVICKDLQRLTSKLKLDNYVSFLGNMHGDQLKAQYEKAHIGIGALGLHRVGLHTASILKIREYCSVGLPFIYSGNDPDFAKDVGFAYKVKQEEDICEIIKVLEVISQQEKLIKPSEIRAYAIANLDFSRKVKIIFNNLI